MPTITSAGVGSGLDIENIIGTLMAAERQPLSKITKERTQINTKVSIYGVIKNSFAELQTAAKKLTEVGNLNPVKANSSDDKIISASASSTASNNTYNLTVSKLAKAQSVAGPAIATADTVVGTGTLTLTLGGYNSGTNLFTQKSGSTPVNIAIGAGQQTLSGIRQAINDANAGVNASIVNDGTGARLVLTSKDTGLENSFKLEVSDDDGTNTNTSGLSSIAFDPSAAVGLGKNATSLQSAQNAEFTINNLAITKTSNTVSDAVEGVTFTLKAETATPIQIGVGLDDSSLKSTLDGFVSAYNKIRGNLKDQQQKDATLSKETTPSTLERGMRNILNDTVSTYGLRLSDIGFNFDKDGVLSLNKTKLDSAITSDPAILSKLFSNTGITSDARVKFLGGTSKTLEGTYAVNITTASTGGSTIAGDINGIAGTGNGNVLTAATGDASEGLQVSVVDGTSGALGTVQFSRGMASRLNEWIESLNAEGGTLASRTEGLNAKIKRLSDQESRFNLTLEQREKRFRKEFTALDSMLANMQKTQSFLQQQLGSLQR